jgi:hypothetical protein
MDLSVAIASEGRFKRSENLIAERAARRVRSDASDRTALPPKEGALRPTPRQRKGAQHATGHADARAR